MTTKPISLSKYKLSDFSTFYALVRDESVMRYITGKSLTEKEAKEKFASILTINTEENEIGYFKVFNADGICIGDCKLERYPQDRSLLEVGYILKEAFWGQGYGTLICKKMLTLASDVAPHTDVVGIIDPTNTASKRLLEKLNFRSFFVGIENDLPTEKLKLSR